MLSGFHEVKHCVKLISYVFLIVLIACFLENGAIGKQPNKHRLTPSYDWSLESCMPNEVLI